MPAGVWSVPESFLLIRQWPAQRAALRGRDRLARRFPTPGPGLLHLGPDHREEGRRGGGRNHVVEPLHAGTATDPMLDGQGLRGEGTESFYSSRTRRVRKALARSGPLGL
jgi:hypothetical protein